MLPFSFASEPIAIAGTGRVAQVLARILFQRNEPVVAIGGRDAARTRAAAKFVGVRALTLPELPSVASRILIAVSDGAIHEVARVLAGTAGSSGIALHTCGAKGAAELEPLASRGHSCGTLHPLQTIASPAQGVAALPGCAFAVSGDPSAVHWAEQIVTCLDGQCLRIPPETRPLYHAASVMASNYTIALIDAAQHLLATAAGMDRPSALRALGPIVRAAVANALENGPDAALTGPIERGDAATVRLHLDALAAAGPVLRDLYRTAGLQTLAIARRKGLPSSAAGQVEATLTGQPT